MQNVEKGRTLTNQSSALGNQYCSEITSQILYKYKLNAKMSEPNYTSFVKKEPVEEDSGMELKFPQPSKVEPHFLNIPESKPSPELKDVSMVKVSCPDQQTVAATSYSCETIVKEELIIDDESEFLEISRCGSSNSKLKDTPNEVDGVPTITNPCPDQETEIAEVTPYTSETIVKEELIIENSNDSIENSQNEPADDPMTTLPCSCRETATPCSSDTLLESQDEELDDDESSGNKKVLICNECNKSFHSRQTYSSHVLRHINMKNRKYSCNFCDKPFSSRADLERHVRALHTNNSARSRGPYNKVWQCHLCPTVCDSSDTYRSHLSTHEQQLLSMFRCEYCSRCFGDQESVQNHVETGQCSKLPKQILVEENGLFKCCECSRVFTLRRSCVQHTKRHFAIRNKTFQCVTCGSLHGTHRELLRHARDHGEIPQQSKERKPTSDTKADKPNIYRCSECPKTFLDRAGCDRHIKRHESLKNALFQCNECGKCYGRDTELRKHVLAHEKKRAKAVTS